MGIRKWMGRRMTVRGRVLGIEDLTEGQEGVPVRNSSPNMILDLYFRVC